MKKQSNPPIPKNRPEASPAPPDLNVKRIKDRQKELFNSLGIPDLKKPSFVGVNGTLLEEALVNVQDKEDK